MRYAVLTAWHGSQAIVNASGDLYTAKTLEKMLDDMGLTETAALLRVEKADLLDTFKAPLVDTCVESLPFPKIGVIRCEHAFLGHSCRGCPEIVQR